MATWIEQGSRGLAHVAMDDFPTFADAIFEIADNPLDYRRGRHLQIDITIDKDADSIVVEDIGGEGMDDEGVSDWLKWGTGHPHEADDIGRYHKGGKAACGYLADSIVILTRRASHMEIWRFEDRQWKSRSEWANYGEPVPYTGQIPSHLKALPEGTGFTRLELTDLEDRRYNVDRLRWMIGNTYRRLIMEGAVTFRLNGQAIEPLALPESSAFERRDDVVALPSGRRARIWVARLDRDAVKSGQNRIQGGIRLLYQRRLISEGEYFGHHAEGKGLLASLIGEVELNHVPPLSNKTGFKRGTPEWHEAEEALHAYLGPIIAEFRRAAEEQPVSREERKRVNQVRRELTEALKQLRTEPGDGKDKPSTEPEPGGRRPPRPTDRPTATPTEEVTSRTQQTARTEAPADAVGVLQRLRRRLRRGDEVPPIDLRDLDPSVRSESLRTGDTVTMVIINRQFPMYKELAGHEAYLAETTVLELLTPAETEKTPVIEFMSQVNQCLEAWSKVSQRASEVSAA